MLGCRNCKFNMHGQERKTWTELAATINPNDLTFTVTEVVDWKAGERIAVAASSFNHYETEEKVIASVSASGLEITVTEPFIYKHYSAVETYGG